jgi:hypothetical protein
MALLGRFLQIVGLVAPLLSIVLQLQQQIDVKTMLLLLVMGVAAFYLGRIIEGYGAPQ